MPKLSTLRILGEYFSLYTKYKYLPLDGYHVVESNNIRLTPWERSRSVLDNLSDNQLAEINIFLDYRNFEGLNKNLSGNSYFCDELEVASLEEISKQLGLKIAVWELNFNSISSYSGQVSTSADFNYNKIFSTKRNIKKLLELGASESSLDLAFAYSPVLAKNTSSSKINSYLAKEAADGLLSEISEDTELLVVTGEMIWSEWLDIKACMELLSENIEKNIKVIIDVTGQWQMMLYVGAKYPELYKLASKYFAPTIDYFVDHKLLNQRNDLFICNLFNEEASRELLIEKNENSLFKTYNEFYETSEEQAAPILYFRFAENKDASLIDTKNNSQKLLSHLYEDLELEKQQQLFQHVIGGFKHGEFEFTGNFNFKLEPGAEIKKSEILGEFTNESYSLIEVPKKYLNADYELVSSHGQFVKKNQEIFRSSGKKVLSVKKYKAPVNGIVNYQYLSSDGIILIKKLQKVQNIKSTFNGKFIKRKELQKYLFELQYYELYCDFVFGNEITGILTSESLEIGNIIHFKSAKHNKLTPENLVAQGFKAVIFDFAELNTINELVDSQVVKKGLLTVIVINLVEQEDIVGGIIKPFLGSYVNVKNRKLKIAISPDFPVSTNNYYPLEEGEGSGLRKGNTVRILDYEGGFSYARIENIDENEVLTMSSDGSARRLNKDNLIKIILG
jgi:hypothetical protein